MQREYTLKSGPDSEFRGNPKLFIYCVPQKRDFSVLSQPDKQGIFYSQPDLKMGLDIYHPIGKFREYVS
jgi:hypothetical protein